MTYSISGGNDAGLFTINGATGNLSFLAAPDFESPADSDGDNVYEVEVTADDNARQHHAAADQRHRRSGQRQQSGVHLAQRRSTSPRTRRPC